MPLSRRAFLRSTLAAGAALRWPTTFADGGELLYNGIRLAHPWPPRNRVETLEPVRPPYLADPPAVINIDVGRQLFVDDFLIQATTLTRRFHRAVYHPRGPVLRPTTAWEKFDPVADRTKTRPNPAARSFSCCNRTPSRCARSGTLANLDTEFLFFIWFLVLSPNRQWRRQRL